LPGEIQFSSEPGDRSQSADDPSELGKLQNEIDGLRARVAEQAQEIQRLNLLAATDPVTGIANRRSFEQEVVRRHSEFLRDDRGFCLMIIDVDGFKRINDQFGKAIGDQLLQKIANVVDAGIRASDIVFRIGGDEFAILLPGTKMQQARFAANRLLEKSVLMIQAQMGDVPVSLSIGLVQADRDRSVETLIDDADQAMYRAKKQGGNRCKLESED